MSVSSSARRSGHLTFRPNRRKVAVRIVRCFVLLLAVLLGVSQGAIAAVTRVGVVDCPTALAWLRAVGVECQAVDAAGLTSAIPMDVQLLVLPLDRVRSDDPMREVTAFAARGGKVIAVYWGTLARQEWQSEYPVYAAATALGFRVTGWSFEGPAIVKMEPPGAPGSVQDLRLERLMLVKAEPAPSAQVLARLAPVSGGMGPVLALRNGNTYYVAANLFHSGTDSPAIRRLFFWILDQAAPSLAYTQARERAGAAMAAVIRARDRLNATSSPNAEAVRRLLDEAQQAADHARALAAASQFSESASAVDQCRELTARATQLLENR